MQKKRNRIRKPKKFTKTMQIKLVAIFAFVLLLLVGLNLRVAYITAKSGDTYAKQVLSQQAYTNLTLPYRRGEILDTNGNVLARSEKQYNLVLDCYAINSDEDYLEPTVRALVSVMGVDETEVRSRITSEETKESQYQVIMRNVTRDEKEAFEEYTSLSDDRKLSKEQYNELNNVQGVWFEEQYKRVYPLNTLASNTIGYSNNNNDGVAGLESYYSSVLNGVNGRQYGYLNENSELQNTTVQPKDGNSIVTTLDVNIQEIVEKYIKELDDELSGGPNSTTGGRGSRNTAVIVANPKTGEIYAMASNHGYDLNDPQDLSELYTDEEVENMTQEELVEALNEKWYNFCVSEAFEPGSVVKPITVSAALESGALKGDENFVCDGGEFVTDSQINCDNIYGHGAETISDAIKNSCNDALMQIGAKMGVETFTKYQRLFHFGMSTGIDLPNENTGLLYTNENMFEVQLATCSFGQGFTCTMVQELAAFCTVVNGGYYYQPHLVKQILDADGGVVKNIEPVLLNQPVSSSNAQIVLDAMEQGVLSGTGVKAQVPGYRVAGKTGTAEKIPRGNGKYLVSFIGCAPADDPEIVVYCVVDEPNVPDQTAGGYPHTLSRKIMSEVLPYLGIYQTEEITDEQLYKLGITMEEAEAGRITETEEPETDEYGNVIDAETETDQYGNVIEAETETDQYGNVVETQSTETEYVAENPNVPSPPAQTTSSETVESNDGVTNEDLGIE